MAITDAASSAMESLPERIRAGEEAAFEAFQKRYAVPFYYYFRRRGLPETDAADLAATCLTDILLKVRDHFDRAHTCFEAWVHLLKQHAAVDWWRQRKRKPTVTLDPDSEIAAADVDAGDEAASTQAEAVAAVADAMDRLDPIDRELLQIRYGGQATWAFEELAAELERRHGRSYRAAALRQRHKRALSKLKAMVSDDPRLRPVLARVEGKRVGVPPKED
jgi:RNA polymerase sigma factor (sigma-70 family)